jgi:ribose transport system permease protein
MDSTNKETGIALLLLRNQQISLAFLVAAICVVFGALSPQFFTATNVMNVVRQLSYGSIAAIGATFLLIAGGVDLSIGSMQAFCGLAAMSTLVATDSVALAVGAGLAAGLLVGLANGVVITKLKIPDIVATLAMMISLRGVDYLATGGAAVMNSTNTAFNKLGSGNVLGIPVPIVIMAALFAVSHVLLKYTRFGRYVYAIGSNGEAALLSGVEGGKVRLFAYLISGLTAAVSAIILAARLNSGQPTAGIGFEFNVLAGVILGGCSLSGGSGNLFGTFVGMLLLTVLRNGFILVGLQSFWQDVLTGVIIVLSIWLNNYKNGLMSKSAKGA